MVYPNAPWTLKGYGVQTVQMLDIKKVRPLIPAELEIVSVWPGKTLGGVYVASYGAGSVLQYNELIVVSGLVSYAGHWGAWISHIYVDNADSMAGGRDIWGLPKQLAEFRWEENSVRVEKGNKQLFSLVWKNSLLPVPAGLQLPFNGPVISSWDNNFLLFKGDFGTRLGLVDAKVEIPAESEFFDLGLNAPTLTVYCDELRLVAGVPEMIGEKKVAYGY